MHNPQTRDGAIRQLGETIRRVHALPLPADAVWRDPRDLIAPMRARLATFTVPSFARTTIDQVLAETPPPRQRPLVTSHNDLNPSNLVFDGERYARRFVAALCATIFLHLARQAGHAGGDIAADRAPDPRR